MSRTYHSDFIILDDGTYVPLKYIESMHIRINDEDRMYDVLTDDVHIDIVTNSGKEYTFSVRRQFKEKEWALTGMAEGIFDKWKHLLKVDIR
jgi:hypothetical protein